MNNDRLQLDATPAARSHFTTRVTPALCCLLTKSRFRTLPMPFKQGESTSGWKKQGVKPGLTQVKPGLSELVRSTIGE